MKFYVVLNKDVTVGMEAVSCSRHLPNPSQSRSQYAPRNQSALAWCLDTVSPVLFTYVFAFRSV